MVEIISKPNGPRKEDTAAKRFLRENSATIMKIADQLSGGGLRQQAAVNPLQAKPATIRARAAPRRNDDKRPYTSISLNGRVIAIDLNSGRQLHYIGEIRGQRERRRFVLATAENRIFAPLEPELQSLLLDLDGCPTIDDAAQEALVKKIDLRLGFSGAD